MNKVIPVSILILLLYFVYFLHLGRQPLRLADEGRLAHNAYNMAKDGDFIVTHFEGKPDMWNTKPPLMILCQAFFIKLIGPNETAMRLPAAICGILTSLLLFYFCWKHLDKFWMGFSAALVLATSNKFVVDHGSRYGEYESMLIFFMTTYALYFFLYLEHKNKKHLYIGAMALILAVLTKGVAGLFILPVVGIAYFFYPEKNKVFKSPHLYLCIFGFIFFVGGYYLLRESRNPGYLNAVNNNELWGRFVNPTEVHDGSFWMYWDYLKNRDMVYWLGTIVCGLAAGLISPEKRISRFTKYTFSCFAFLFLVVSASASKLHWYAYPMYPYLALLSAYFIWMVFEMFLQSDVKRFMKHNALPYFFIFILFLYPYDNMLAKIYLAPENQSTMHDYGIGYYLQRVLNGKQKLNEPLKVFYNGQNAHVTFYVNLLKEKNYPVLYTGGDNFVENDLVICSLPEDKKFLKEHFNTDSIGGLKTAVIYRLKELKPQSPQ